MLRIMLRRISSNNLSVPGVYVVRTCVYANTLWYGLWYGTIVLGYAYFRIHFRLQNSECPWSFLSRGFIYKYICCWILGSST
jgi:hypothetical protein